MYSFGKENILTHKKEIEHLFISKNKVKGKFILLKYTPPLFQNDEKNDEKINIKFLFIVPKRKFKKAVDRNRIKRLLREAVRLNKNLLSKSSILLNIQLAYLDTKIKSFEEITADIQYLFTKINTTH